MAALKNLAREALRAELSQVILSALDICKFSDKEIGDIMIVAPSRVGDQGSYFRDESWTWPESMFPVRHSYRTISFFHLAAFPKLCADLKRFVAASLLFPLGRYSDLAGTKKRVLYLSKLFAAVGEFAGDLRFDEISEIEFADAFRMMAGSLGPSTISTLGGYVLEICTHAKRGNIPRGLARVPTDLIVRLAAGIDETLPERPETSQADSYGKYQPLPDAYVAEAGLIWMYYVRHLLPNFVNVASLMMVTASTVQAGRELAQKTIWAKQLARRNEILKAFEWNDANGVRIRKLPFSTIAEFPPRTVPDYLSLLSSAQASLMQLLALVTGGRAGEIDALKRNCLDLATFSQVDMPTIRGVSFKVSGQSVGDARIWPIPREIANGIATIIQIGDIMQPESEYLWVTINLSGQSSFPMCYRGFVTFPRTHGLAHHFEFIGSHPHRFRKTIARLAILTLVGAPMILQDIFGHSELQSLLRYILTNPDIRTEMAEMGEQTAKEQAHVVGENLDEAGGKGAQILRAARERFFDQISVPTNERAQQRRIHEFAESVIADGTRDLKFIYPGIVCTKAKAARGNCSSDEKVIDPTACETACQFFLALPSAKADTRHLIEWLLDQINEPAISANPLLINFYRAQLYDQVRVYDELKAHYLDDARYVSAFAEPDDSPALTA